MKGGQEEPVISFLCSSSERCSTSPRGDESGEPPGRSEKEGPASQGERILINYALAFAILDRMAAGNEPPLSSSTSLHKTGRELDGNTPWMGSLQALSESAMLAPHGVLRKKAAKALLSSCVLGGLGNDSESRRSYIQILDALWRISQSSTSNHEGVIRCYISVLLNLTAEMRAGVCSLTARENSSLFFSSLCRVLLLQGIDSEGSFTGWIELDHNLASHVMSALAEASLHLTHYPLEQGTLFAIAKCLERILKS